MDKKPDRKSFKDKVKNGLTKKKLKSIYDRYGFYIVLLLCVCIVGATAVFANGGRSIDDTKDKQARATEPAPTETGDEIIIDVDKDSPVKSDGCKDCQDCEDDKDDAGNDSNKDSFKGAIEQQEQDGSKAIPASQDNADRIAMIMPVDGEILKGYTGEDELAFSETLKQWSAHKGIDISSAPGSEVKAALDGIVKSINEDPLRGIEIVLKHDDAITTIYTGVSTKEMIKVGQKVTQGQAISGIGQTATFEILDPSHLHFEVLIDGKHRDPMDYMKE